MPLREYLLGLHLLVAVSLFGQDPSPKSATEEAPEKLLLSNLKGIVLTSSRTRLIPRADLAKVEGVELIHLTLPGDAEDLKKRLLPFLNHPLTTGGLRQIKNAIGTYYVVHYHPLVRVIVPSQEITKGILQLVVIESVLGKVTVEGNEKWSSPSDFLSRLELTPGQPIDNQVLLGDLNFFNRNPYRTVSAIFRVTDQPATTDLLLLVEDRPRSYQFYVGTDNSGIQSTKEQLYFGGMNLFNLFYHGHIFSFQYTTSDFHALQAYTFQYIVPLYHRHLLNLFGGYSTYFPASVPFVKTNNGYTGQLSARYIIPLLPSANFKHEIATGFDYKVTNTDVGYSADVFLTAFHQTVNLTQWMVSYSGFFQQKEQSLQYLAEIYFSPFEWLHDQSNTDYGNLRPGAKNRWIYGRGSIYYYRNLPRSFYLALSLRGQTSSTSLLPSEQFNLGGYNTVRGYDQNIVNQDQAFLVSAELHSPSWRLAKLIRGKTSTFDELHLLAFADFSYGSNHVPIAGQNQNEHLLGVGPGMRYRLEELLICRLDWGVKLRKNAQIGTSLGFIHFSLMVSY